MKFAFFKKQTVVYLVYFRLCFLISVCLPFHKVMIDYRTGSVSTNKFKNRFKNFNMKIESIFFRNVLVISNDLRKHLNLPKRAIVRQVGSDIISHEIKRFNDLKLLYVGTLYNRNVHETIYGISKFKKMHYNVSIQYFIIGNGDTSLIIEEIKKYKLENEIKVLGFVPAKDIVKYYNKCNVGICYAPMTDFYMPQPFTKLYEYTLSGMAVISVRLLDSIQKVNKYNGVLCNDNPESFADALEQIYINKNNYDSQQIREEFSKYTWENLSNQFKRIIDD